MIDLDNVAVSYGERALFQDVTLALEPGSFYFLTGPSGAGKTTLLKLCSLEMLPIRGEVRLLGRDTKGMSRNAIANMRRLVGIVHQESRFVDHLTVGENIQLPLAVSGRAEPVASDLEELLSWIGLSGYQDRLPPELSGGERQRVALARAIILSPEIVLADEPTGNVDWEMSLKLLDLLVELNKLGKTILCATHDLNLIRQAKQKISARVLRIRDGAVTAAGAEL